MKYDFKRLTIKSQLLILFILFVVLAAINFFVLHYFVQQVEDTRQQIDLADQLPHPIRVLTQAAEEINANNEEAESKLRYTSKQIDKLLTVFDQGGKYDKESDYLDPVNGEERLEVDPLIDLWDSVQQNIQILRFDPYMLDTIQQDIIQVPNNDSLNTTHTEVVDKKVQIPNPVIAKAKAFITDHKDDLLSSSESLIALFAAKHKKTKSTLQSVILIIVFINLVIGCLLLLGIKKIILDPLKQLEGLTDKLTHGEFNVERHFEWKNEVSFIAEKVNTLAHGLQNATDFVKEVGKGELDKEYKGLDHDDINENSLEAALLNMRDQMKKVDQEEEIRNWSTGGLAKFVDILRSSNDDVTELSNKIISNLVEYTHSNQGGLYLLNDEDETNKHLELISLYAFDSFKYDKQSYRLGEGLVGQTFLERKTTYLLEVPNDYITITSGLGGTNPKAILIVPLQVNEEIFGILELASFEEYKAYEIEFVEKLGESIASTISSVKNNQRTKRLLQESQELTEQMQAQEEEMRQNMEELSATQEEMARKEIEITAQLTAINNSLGTVEYEGSGIITNTNEIFEEAMGYHSGELHDKAFKAIYKGDQDIWAELQNGIGQSGEFNFSNKDGESVILVSTFTPIKNDDGEVYKVIQLVTQFGEKQDHSSDKNWAEVEAMEATLRQHLEGLEITQQELNAKKKEVESKLALISSNLQLVSIDQKLAIRDINESFLQFTGKNKSEILGRPVAELLGESIVQALDNKKNVTTITLIDQQGKEQEKLASLIYQSPSDINIFIL